MRTVYYVSGSRADYGPARSTLLELQRAEDVDLRVVVTAMHLDPEHGETWQELEQDGLDIEAKIPGREVGDSLHTMAASFGAYVKNFSAFFESNRPDILLVLGDRSEILAASIAAGFHNITVAHLCGGSVSGSFDDAARHAITKFSHYHLTAEPSHTKRVIQMGEQPDCVMTVGLPGGDLSVDVVHDHTEVCERLGLPANSRYILMIQHAVTHQQNAASSQIKETIKALADLDLDVILANPNDDAGGRAILAALEEAANNHPRCHLLKPPRSRQWFASIMAHAELLVGNSSSGTVEAISVGLPVVNIGERQQGREHLSCMLSVPHERSRIRKAVDECLSESSEYRQRLRTFHSSFLHRGTPKNVLQAIRKMDHSLGRSAKHFFDTTGEQHDD